MSPSDKQQEVWTGMENDESDISSLLLHFNWRPR